MAQPSRDLLTPWSFARTLGLFGVFCALAAVLSPLVGAVSVSPTELWRAITSGHVSRADVGVEIVLFQRIPRVLLGLICGGALALAGGVFQALLRNPLATPYTLGVSGGAALGAVIAISFGVFSFHVGPVHSVQLLALAGSVVNIGIVYLLARARGHFSTAALLLCGVTLGLISSAMILFVRYLSHPNELVMLDRWMMGGLDIVGYQSILSVLPFLAPGVIILLAMASSYNQLAFGEELAAGRGVNVPRIQQVSFFAGSLATSAVVSVCGPIGFVGLIVPHIVRRLIGPDHRLLLPCSVLAGGGFLVLCDTFSRTVIAPSELPVGIVTAMLGGPFFLWLLVSGGMDGGGRR